GAPSEPPAGAGPERRVSRSLWELEQRSYSRSSLGSALGPDAEEEAEAEAEARRLERLAEEQRQRAELADQYRQLLAERARRRQHNARLQGQLGALLGKGKSTERARAGPGPGPEPRVSDREQRYGRYLAALEELRGQRAAELAGAREREAALRRAGQERQALVGGQWRAYQAAAREVAVYTTGRRLGGRRAAVQAVEQIQAREQAKEEELTQARLENIKLKRRIQKLEASLKAQEELAEGLHLIDFEQLKIENQTYNEKIEERNEELLKLRRKITNTVQVLTQVKEKLQFVEAQNQGQKVQLMAVEALVAQKREILTKTKQARDKLRMDNQKLQQKCGLLGNTLLLRDFEDKVAANELLHERLEKLKRQHAGLCLTCKGVKKKIQGAKSFLPL
ncbi:coiled-coil domain-containing protein 96, partial [Varanus komodoensis]|uniref:coiled-coil domain-containing protein 96 n=1 Tax=Varanus komodoensis TaxID=61221 RepID=UPI001CF77F1D